MRRRRRSFPSALEARFETGGVTEAAIRALIYIRLASSTVDERGFSILKAVRSMRPAAERLHLAELKDLFRNQFLLVKLDEERAVAAIPKLLAGVERAAPGGARCRAAHRQRAR